MSQTNRDNSRGWQTTNTGGTNYVGEIHFHGNEPKSPLTRQEYRNRQALLTKVNNFWVKGVLEKSLYNQVIIELGLEERPDAITNPWSVIIETDDSSPQSLPDGTKIIDIFDQIGAGRTLLILGEPGSGKTTTLLELTRDLIARAEQDINLLIPAVFNLSSWANKRETIADWLVEELNTKYDVPKKIGQDWVTQQQLLPLLDGLDEVKAEYRDHCIAALNQFKQEYGAELVVCSRIKDYEALSNRLNFQSAVYIRLLTLEQIYNYLNSVGADLTGLRTLIVEDTVLQELAQSPLMLNIMTLAYQGVAVGNLPKTEVLEERRRQLFDDYIENMFKRRKTNQRHTIMQVKHWLIWLGARMVQNSQTVFFIEKMQPYLLTNRKSEQIYKLISGLIVGLVFMLVVGLVFMLVVGLIFMLVGRLVFMSIVGLILILIVGLIVGLMKRKNPEEIKTVEIVRFNWNKFKNNLIGSLIVRRVNKEVNKEMNKKMNKLIELMGPEEALNTLIGSIFWWLARTIIWLIGALIEALIEGLTRGFENSEIETKISPNEGIRKSVRNAIRFGLIVGLIFGLIFGSIIGLIVKPIVGLIVGLIIGLIIGLIVGLISGGYACIQHFSLRLILYFNNYIPWNYARFLDYATERIFLQKVGGGYIFVHRMLMEHFAQMELEP